MMRRGNGDRLPIPTHDEFQKAVVSESEIVACSAYPTRAPTRPSSRRQRIAPAAPPLRRKGGIAGHPPPTRVAGAFS